MADAYSSFNTGLPFKDDIQAEAERKSKEKVEAMKLLGSKMKATGESAFKPEALAPDGVSDPFKSFQDSLKTQDPAYQALKMQTQKAVTDGLTQPQEGLGMAADQSRGQLIKSMEAARAQTRADNIRAFGPQSSAIPGALQDFDQQAILQRADLEGQLAIGDADARQKQKADSLGNAMQFLGQSGSEDVARQGLGLEAIKGGEQSRQFGEGLAFQRSEGAAGRGSTEKIAFAGLSVEEKKVAMAASQFDSKLDWDKEALRLGMDENSRDRAWQAVQQEKQIGSQEKIAFAGLSLEEKKIAQNGMQFASDLDFKKSSLAASLDDAGKQRVWQSIENEKSRTSSERVSFAQLNVEEKKLAQDAMQFGSEMDFRKSELASNLKEADKQRLWTAGENEKGRVLDEKLAFAQIGSTERLQEAEFRFNKAENGLNRSLELDIEANRIKATSALQTSQQSFDKLMNATGFVQTKELETIKQQFAKDLQAKGFTQEQILQASQQQFQGLEAQRDRTFNEQQNAFNLKWQTGERLSTQDFQSTMQASEFKFQETQENLNRVLQLDVQGNDIKYKEAAQRASEIHDALMQDGRISAEQALQYSQQAFQGAMQAAGFTQEQTMQGQRLTHDATQAEKSRAAQEMMFYAQEAQNNSQFFMEMGLKREEVDLRKSQFDQEMTLRNKEFGLTETQMNAALSSDKVKNAISMASIGIEMTDGSEAAMQPFVDMLHGAIGGYAKEQGINLPDPKLANLATKWAKGNFAEMYSEGKGMGFSEADMRTAWDGAQGRNGGSASKSPTFTSALPSISRPQDFVEWKQKNPSGMVNIEGKEVQVTQVQSNGGIVLSVEGKKIWYDPAKNQYIRGDKSGSSKIHSTLQGAINA